MGRWPKVTLAGIEAEVVPDEVAETANVYLCVPWDTPGFFPDDQRGTCAACGGAVRFRPYGPKKPPKVCIRCITAWIEARGG